MTRRALPARAPRVEPVPARRKILAWVFVGLLVFSVLTSIALVFAR